MPESLSIAELLDRGIVIPCEDAVAVACAIAYSAPVALAEPETPTAAAARERLAGVLLSPQGTVTWQSAEPLAGPRELAVMLDVMLATSARVPGPLRYAVARALRMVDAPAFVSPESFADTLARFAPADASTALSRLFTRGVPAAHAGNVAPFKARTRPTAAHVGVALPMAVSSAISPGLVDRRRIPPEVRELRRQQHAADLRQLAGLLAAHRPPTPAQAPPPVAAASSLPRRSALAAAALAAVLLSGATGYVVVRLADRLSIEATAPAAPVAAVGPAEPTALAPLAASPLPTVNVPLHSAADGSASHEGSSASAVEEPLSAPASADAPGQLVSEVDVQQRPVFSPAFARTDSALFFHTGGSRDARSALARATADGNGELRVITLLDDGARNYHVQPSPDGRWIAFDSDRDGDRGVYIAKQDGSSVRRVSGAGYAAVPTWSPDGRWLAFVRAEAGNSRVWNLWRLPIADDVVSTVASDAERLTHLRFGQPWGASWFPDGRRICYSHEDTMTVLDLASGRSQDYRSPVRGRLVRTPAVSPDGRRVIFQVFRDGAWMLDLEDGSMRRVLDDPTAEEFAWAPGGHRVAYHSRRKDEWGIFVLAGN